MIPTYEQAIAELRLRYDLAQYYHGLPITDKLIASYEQAIARLRADYETPDYFGAVSRVDYRRLMKILG